MKAKILPPKNVFYSPNLKTLLRVWLSMYKSCSGIQKKIFGDKK